MLTELDKNCLQHNIFRRDVMTSNSTSSKSLIKTCQKIPTDEDEIHSKYLLFQEIPRILRVKQRMRPSQRQIAVDPR